MIFPVKAGRDREAMLPQGRIALIQRLNHARADKAHKVALRIIVIAVGVGAVLIHAAAHKPVDGPIWISPQTLREIGIFLGAQIAVRERHDAAAETHRTGFILLPHGMAADEIRRCSRFRARRGVLAENNSPLPAIVQ